MNNSEQISASRWTGRLNGVVFYLTKKYPNIFEDCEWDNFNEMLSDVQTYAPGQDAEIVAKLIKKIESTMPLPNEMPTNHRIEKQRGVGEVKYILSKGHNLVDVLNETDFYALKRKSDKKRNYLIFSVVAVLFFSGIIYNLPYFAEKRDYQKVLESRNQWDCEMFIQKYPTGKYVNEVRKIIEETDYNIIINPEYGTATISRWEIDNFKEKYPNSKYNAVLEAKFDSIVDCQIQKYAKNSIGVSDVVKYITEIIQYLKNNNLNEIEIVYNKPNIYVKDLNDYGSTYMENLRLQSPITPSQYVSVKSFFKELTDQNVAKSAINSKIEDLFEDIVPLMDIKIADSINISTESDKNKKRPQIFVDYSITNRSVYVNGMHQPTLIEVSFFSPIKSIYSGLSVSMTLRFETPDKTSSYIYKGTASTQNRTSLNSDKAIYQQFIDMCCNDCLANLNTKLGINNE